MLVSSYNETLDKGSQEKTDAMLIALNIFIACVNIHFDSPNIYVSKIIHHSRAFKLSTGMWGWSRFV